MMKKIEVGNIVEIQGADKTNYIVVGFDMRGVVYLYPAFVPVRNIGYNSIETYNYNIECLMNQVEKILTTRMVYRLRDKELVQDNYIIDKEKVCKNFIKIKDIDKGVVITWYLRNKLYYPDLPVLQDDIEPILDNIQQEFLSEHLIDSDFKRYGIYQDKSGFKILYLGYSTVTKMHYYIKLSKLEASDYRLGTRKIKSVTYLPSYNMNKIDTYKNKEELNSLILSRGVRID